MDVLSEISLEAPRNDLPEAGFKKVVVNNQHLISSSNDHKQNDSASSKGIKQKGAKNSTKMRFVVCTLGLISLTLSQMSRMVLNLNITSMVDPSMHVKSNAAEVSSDGSCPWPEESDIALSTPSSVIDPLQFYLTAPTDWVEKLAGNETTYYDLITSTQSGQVETIANDNEIEFASSPEESVDRFKWTMKQQNVLLGGFYYSYFFFMILGGRLAEVYGAKYVLLLAVAGSASINLMTPFLARNSFYLLVLSRIIMGILQSGVFPAMYALFNKWLTMSEASIYAPLIKMNLRLGMLFGSLLPGLLPNWWSVFYFTGVLSTIWSLAWFFIATSEPENNDWVSKEELDHIVKKKTLKPQERKSDEVELNDRTVNGISIVSKSSEKSKKKPSLKTPWLKILTAPSVIGLIIVKLTLNYAIDFLSIELPSYLKYVHHASTQQISFLITFMFAIQVVLIVFVGWLAKSAVEQRPFGITKTGVRKLFQGTCSLGIAALMFLMTFNNCSVVFVGVLLQMISFVSIFMAGGETMLPYDLSEEYPATIMGIANSVANISGITTTVIAGFVLGDQGGNYARWNILMYLIVCVNIIGGAAFLLLVKAEPIDFEDDKSKKNSPQPIRVDMELGQSSSGTSIGKMKDDATVGLVD